MNVVFHALGAAATASLLSPQLEENPRSTLLAGFCVGIALHGLLDHTPHSYPLRSNADVALASTALSLAAIAFRARGRLRP